MKHSVLRHRRANRLATALLTLLATVSPLAAGAQLTLDECQRLARDNYPLLKQYGLVEQATDYTVANVRRGYLPQLVLSGQASLQSGAPRLPGALADVLQANGYDYKGMAKDQYRVVLDLSQVVWDGGELAARREVAAAEGRVQKARTTVGLYDVRRQVDELFFGILLLDERLRLNADLQTLLHDNCRKLEQACERGTAMRSDVDAMRAEYLEARRDRIALTSAREAYVQMLALFVGRETAAVEELQKPSLSPPLSGENRRPELELFASRMAQATAQERQLDAGLHPRLSLFAQGYYGYPGYDMFADMFGRKWSLNGIVGLRLTWDIGRLYTLKNDRRKLDVSRRMVEVEQEAFLFGSRLQSVQESGAVEQYRQMMAEDEGIIALRASVRQAAEEKLAHGVIGVNDLLQEITRENQARIERSAHEIEMLKSIAGLRHTLNQPDDAAGQDGQTY